MRWWTSSARLACCKPEISILSDAFLAEVRDLPQRNVALELFRTLLDDEIAVRLRRNMVQGRSCAQMLERAIRAYQNRSLAAAEVISQALPRSPPVSEPLTGLLRLRVW